MYNVSVLVRDPALPALSQFFQARRLGLKSLELKAAQAAEPERLS